MYGALTAVFYVITLAYVLFQLNGTSSDLAAVVVVIVSLLTHINTDVVFYSLSF
jgi:hypothetical protein